MIKTVLHPEVSSIRVVQILMSPRYPDSKKCREWKYDEVCITQILKPCSMVKHMGFKYLYILTTADQFPIE